MKQSLFLLKLENKMRLITLTCFIFNFFGKKSSILMTMIGVK